LADVVFVKETVNAAILLIQGDKQWDWVTGLMGDCLKLLNKFRSFLGSCSDQHRPEGKVIQTRKVQTKGQRGYWEPNEHS
jgi:hypothetical protein